MDPLNTGTGTGVGRVSPQCLRVEDSFALQDGSVLPGFELMYETYGTLNAAKSNAILVCHALSGHHHVAGEYADGSIGWWDNIVGPGRPLDTERFFVVGVNNLGGCHGSTGPSSLNPATGQPWGANWSATRRFAFARSRRLKPHGPAKSHFSPIRS